MVYPSCLAHAANSYSIAAPAIEAVLSKPATAGGVGPMHIPATWLPVLSRIGFSRQAVIANRCTNIAAGAWIMAFEAWRGAMKSPPGNHSAPPALPPAVQAISAHAAVSTACITGAAHFYHLPVRLFAAVLRTEGGHVGQIHRNANGSYDMGPAQINSTWLPTLAKAGISRAMVLQNGCLNVSIGAWILAQAMVGADPHDPRQFWRHVGDYNSHTPRWNEKYAANVWNNLN